VNDALWRLWVRGPAARCPSPVVLKWGYVYPWGYVKALQGVRDLVNIQLNINVSSKTSFDIFCSKLDTDDPECCITFFL